MKCLGVDVLSEILLYLDITQSLQSIKVCKLWKKAFKRTLHKRSINFAGTNVTDEGLKWLQGVCTINLGDTEVTDEGLKWLQGVHTIDLRSTEVTDEGLKWLQGVHTHSIFTTQK